MPAILPLLLGCAERPPTPAEADAAWADVVGARISAELRAIRADGDHFVADVPGATVTVRLDATGAAIASDDGKPRLALRLSAWGREGATRTPRPVAPAFGACTDDVDARGRCVPRLEYARDGVIEWWAGRDDGLAQGWSLATAPVGTGALVFDVAADGAGPASADGKGATITDAAGATWDVGGLAAWDADGRALPISIAAVDGGLRVTVDDAGARYPVEVDPVYTDIGDLLLGSEGYFGQALAPAGDVDGDGYPDLVVGMREIGRETGRVYVYHGSATGLSTTATTTIDGPFGAYAYFGAAVAGAGDVNGDGYDDIVVGAPIDDDGIGAACVYLGSASGVSDTAAATWHGNAAHDDFGWSVSDAGDVDGDGYDDVVVGGYGAGAAYLYAGGPSGPSSTPTVTMAAPTASSWYGYAVAIAGDLDRDGYDDVVVGAPYYGSYAGRVYVYPGSASGIPTTPTITLTGADAHGELGWALAGAGDVDGDGYADLLAGAPYVDRAYVYAGGPSGPSAATTRIDSPFSDGDFGGTLASAGDVDGDGFDDVVIGAAAYDRSTGAACVYLGSAAGLATSPIFSVTGAARVEYMGGAVAGPGDLDGDGYDDVVISAYNEGAGTVRVYPGSSAGTSSTATVELEGEETGLGFGLSLASAGDVDGDGYDDVVVGAYDYDTYAGRVYLFPGSADGLSDTAATTLTGTASSYFGYAVAGAGDVDADGYDDVIIGAYAYSSSNGRVEVHHGSASGLESAARTTIDGTARASLGKAVAGAGDVNGDGYDDILVAEPSYDSSRGRVSLYVGSAAGVGTSATTTITGTAVGDAFGSAVDGAGDVNADGYDDVIVGAPSAHGNFGEADVFAGAMTGLPSPASTLITGTSLVYSGTSVAGVGDVNGDGYDDVAVGAGQDVYIAGYAAVHLGSASGVSSTAAATWSDTDPKHSRLVVAAAGDVDDDGYADVAVGANDAGTDYTGRVDVYLGGAAVPTSPDVSLDGSGYFAHFGYALDGADVDGDGYGDLVVGGTSRVEVYRGYADTDGDGVAVGDDCDDADSGVGGAATWYADGDGDGYGGTTSTTACAAPSGYVATDGDCDDTRADVSPAGMDVPGDGVDQDCDGADAPVLPDTGAADTAAPADTGTSETDTAGSGGTTVDTGVSGTDTAAGSGGTTVDTGTSGTDTAGSGGTTVDTGTSDTDTAAGSTVDTGTSDTDTAGSGGGTVDSGTSGTDTAGSGGGTVDTGAADTDTAGSGGTTVDSGTSGTDTAGSGGTTVDTGAADTAVGSATDTAPDSGPAPTDTGLAGVDTAPASDTAVPADTAHRDTGADTAHRDTGADTGSVRDTAATPGDSGGDTDADTDADSDTDTDADSDTDADTDTDSDTDTDTDADSDTDIDADTDTDSDGDTDSDTDADADTDTDTDADDGAGAHERRRAGLCAGEPDAPASLGIPIAALLLARSRRARGR